MRRKPNQSQLVGAIGRNWFITEFARLVIGRSTLGLVSLENAPKIDLGAKVMILNAFGRPQSQVAFHAVIFGYLLRSLQP